MVYPIWEYPAGVLTISSNWK